jgi:hypothetical protein
VIYFGKENIVEIEMCLILDLQLEFSFNRFGRWRKIKELLFNLKLLRHGYSAINKIELMSAKLSTFLQFNIKLNLSINAHLR